MMLKLLFVGDGPRDEAAVPRLVAGLLGVAVSSEFEGWARLHRRGAGRGLARKLQFAIRQALDRRAAGVVATCDADQYRSSAKLTELRDAREQDRARGTVIPTALGEAIPHLEAWLLDDPVAVRTALGLSSTTEISSPTKVRSPKDELNRLHDEYGCTTTILETLTHIAAALSVRHCNHASETGFEEFTADVAQELGPLVGS
jgi:hypothetical protein